AAAPEGLRPRRYARLVGAPNCAPSLRSVAGLLLALALQSGLRGSPPTSHEIPKCATHPVRASARLAERGSASSCFPGRKVSPSAGFVAAAQDQRRALEKISTGRRGVSSEGHPQQERG